jgi:hypothetical protein
MAICLYFIVIKQQRFSLSEHPKWQMVTVFVAEVKILNYLVTGTSFSKPHLEVLSAFINEKFHMVFICQ